MKTKTTNKTHGLFWSLIRDLDGYTESMKEDIKESLVSSFSNEKTTSLSEMYLKYPAEYAQMIEAIKATNRRGAKAKQKKFDAEGNKWRKRCLAAVCTWLDLRNISFESDAHKISYAIAVICRSANCGDFDLITIGRLTDVYNEFVRKQQVVRDSLKIRDFGVGMN